LRKTFSDRSKKWALDIWCNKEESINDWNNCVQEIMK
jgi:hypothetical protein